MQLTDKIMQTSKALGYLSAFSLIFFAAGCASAKPEPLPSVETPPPAAENGALEEQPGAMMDDAGTTEQDDSAMKDSGSTKSDLDLDKELEAMDKEINSVDTNDYNPSELPTDYNNL